MAEEKEEKKENNQNYSVVEIPTQTTYRVFDKEGDRPLEDKEVLAEILNRLKSVEKLLG